MTKIRCAFMLLMALALLQACSKDPFFDFDLRKQESTGGQQHEGGRVTPALKRNVMILVSGGRNSLASYLREDLDSLLNGKFSIIPESNFPGEHALVVLSRIGGQGTYYNEKPAVLYQVYKDRNGNVRKDTLKVWGGFTPVFGENTLQDALNIVKQEIPAEGYGIVFSSHGSGYLPRGYYEDPGKFEKDYSSDEEEFLYMSPRSGRAGREEFPPIPEWPAVKSFGQDLDKGVSSEMELKDLCNAIPYHLKYILMDMCLMGGVETAYELREKADYIGFSPTEIMADGFDYSIITRRLLKDTPDVLQVCRDYISLYKGVKRIDPYATITLVRTDKMEAFATVCKDLFEKYRDKMSAVSPAYIQKYFRYNRHYFYDLRHIMECSGVSAEDLSALDDALQECIVYTDHTERFLDITLTNCSGFSMYLPANGSPLLSKFYKENIAWNAATELIR